MAGRQPRLRCMRGEGFMARLFVALGDIPVDQELARAIAELLAGVPGARATAPESRHVTLAFIGDAARSQMPRIEAACAEAAAETRAQSYVLDQLGGFPRAEARIVALTGVTPPGLGRLAQGLGDRLRAGGFPVERRPLRMHVTVGRLRESYRIPRQDIAPLHVMAEEIRLYESELLPAGARYHLVSAFALPSREEPSA